jgi:hypothetical protein
MNVARSMKSVKSVVQHCTPTVREVRGLTVAKPAHARAHVGCNARPGTSRTSRTRHPERQPAPAWNGGMKTHAEGIERHEVSNAPSAQSAPSMPSGCIVMHRPAPDRPVAHRGDTRKTAYLSRFLGMGPGRHRTSLTSIYYECEGFMHNHAHRPKRPKTLVGSGGMRI